MAEDIFMALRKNIREYGKSVIDHVIRNHFSPGDFAGEPDICSFCGAKDLLTKEHVLPKWIFENDSKRTFITKINESSQSFIKSVVPCCANCNNKTLAKVEQYIVSLFRNTKLPLEYFEVEETLNIIRWLEIIDYKFHVFNFRRKYIRHSKENFIPFVKDVPLSVMRLSIDMSPYKALSQLRNSQARIRRKDKDSRYYSLVFWKSKNKEPLFFHSLDEFIF
jgi:hypothetical protein